MSNFYNRYFGGNNNDSDSESSTENTQENPIISTSQPGRELDESNISGEERQPQRRYWNTSEFIESTNRIIASLSNNENLETTEENPEQNFINQTIITDNSEQQSPTMDNAQFNQLIAALGQ